MSAAGPLSRVAVALDSGDWATFRRWAALFGPRVGVLKVGLEAFIAFGPQAVAEARRHSPAVFLDLKLHDIPHTVAGAVAAARAHEVRYLTVHAGGGAAMLAVTLLTHLDQAGLERLELPGSAAERVRGWTALARQSGAAGVICSPREVEALRADNPPPFLLVTPGIRAQGGGGDDQRRTASAAAALAAGADLLVIGRPLTAASDPEAALTALADELS